MEQEEVVPGFGMEGSPGSRTCLCSRRPVPAPSLWFDVLRIVFPCIWPLLRFAPTPQDRNCSLYFIPSGSRLDSLWLALLPNYLTPIPTPATRISKRSCAVGSISSRSGFGISICRRIAARQPAWCRVTRGNTTFRSSWIRNPVSCISIVIARTPRTISASTWSRPP